MSLQPSPPKLADLFTQLAHSLAQAPPPLPLRWTAPSGLSFQPLSPDEQRHAYAELRSANPLRLSRHPGQVACLRLPPLDHIQPDTLYQFPSIVFEILGEDGETLGQHTIQPGQFRTFNAGNPVSQVLEFVATILDYELAPLGFRCRREQSQLSLFGQAEAAGLNLKVAQLRVEPGQQGKICPLGLKTGQSTCDPQQRPGRSPATYWGHFTLNGETFLLASSHLYTPTRELAAEAITTAINARTGNTGVYASFDADDHLVLRHQKAGSEGLIHLQNMPPPALPPGTEALELQLPDGIVTGPEHLHPEQLWFDLGHMVLNQIPIPLGRFSRQEHTADSLAAIVLARINSRKAITAIEADLEQGRLRLSLCDPHRELSVTALYDSQQQPLDPHPSGLTCFHHAAPATAWQPLWDTLGPIQAALQTWSEEGFDTENLLINGFPLGSGLRLSGTGALVIEEALLQARIQTFAPIIATWAEQVAHRLRTLPAPASPQAQPTRAPLPLPAQTPLEDERPTASFDHQI